MVDDELMEVISEIESLPDYISQNENVSVPLELLEVLCGGIRRLQEDFQNME